MITLYHFGQNYFPFLNISHFITVDTELARSASSLDQTTVQLKQCHFLFKQALDADEAGLREKALELYTQAVEVALNTVRNLQVIVYSYSITH